MASKQQKISRQKTNKLKQSSTDVSKQSSQTRNHQEYLHGKRKGNTKELSQNMNQLIDADHLSQFKKKIQEMNIAEGHAK